MYGPKAVVSIITAWFPMRTVAIGVVPPPYTPIAEQESVIFIADDYGVGECMGRYCWSRLTSLQVGKYGECFARLMFMEYGFEIFRPEAVNGEIDFVLRKGPDSYLEIKVETIRSLSCIDLPGASFTPRPNLFAVVILLEDRHPPYSFLIPSTAWEMPNALLLALEGDGFGSQPKCGLNLSEQTRPLLDKFEFHRVIEQLLVAPENGGSHVVESSAGEQFVVALPAAEAVELEDLAARPAPDVEPENPCRICGQQIEAGRLQVLPQTDICASCVKELSGFTQAGAAHTPPARRLSDAELDRVKQKTIADAAVPQIRWPKGAPTKCPRCGGPTEIRLLGYNRIPVVVCMKGRDCQWRFTRRKRRKRP